MILDFGFGIWDGLKTLKVFARPGRAGETFRVWVAAAIICTMITLVLGYSLRGQWLLLPVIIGPGLIWLAGQRWCWSWPAPAGLVLFIGLAALGVWLKVSSWWLLFSVMSALFAWDLSRFSERLDQTTNVVNLMALKQIHFRRLQIVAGSGILLGVIALGLQLQLNFGRAVLLSLLLAVSLSWGIRLIRRMG